MIRTLEAQTSNENEPCVFEIKTISAVIILVLVIVLRKSYLIKSVIFKVNYPIFSECYFKRNFLTIRRYFLMNNI